MFENISIWGRIAYGICCLENYISSLGYPKDEWKIVFKQLWSIHKIEYVDDWLYATIEYLPECILEFSDFDSPSDWEYIDETTYKYLYGLYSQCPKQEEINTILKAITDICSAEIYGGTYPPAPSSLAIVNENFIPVIKKLDIRLPCIKYFNGFSIYENHCWGVKISREMINIPCEFA